MAKMGTAVALSLHTWAGHPVAASSGAWASKRRTGSHSILSEAHAYCWLMHIVGSCILLADAMNHEYGRQAIIAAVRMHKCTVIETVRNMDMQFSCNYSVDFWNVCCCLKCEPCLQFPCLFMLLAVVDCDCLPHL